MSRGFRIFLAFLAGLVAGQALPLIIYFVATTFFGLVDRDGGGAMGAFFILGPVCALVAGTVAAIIVAKRTAR